MFKKSFKFLPVVLCLGASVLVSATNSRYADQEIARKVHEKIGSGWFSTGYDKVNVEVNNGVVTISGYVKTADDKEKLERSVRNTNGVVNVNNEVRIQDTDNKNTKKYSQDTYATYADQELNNKIRDAVSNGWLWDSYKDVSLHTKNGVVTIEGSVKSPKDQQKIIDEIQKVKGIKNVRSNLRIENDTALAYSENSKVSDEDLSRKVQEKIGGGWFSRGYDEVNFQVKNGVVSLSGFVKTADDRENVERSIRNIDGVVSVDSKIRIQDTASKTPKKYPQDSYATSSDEQLNKKIRDEVSNGWLWDSYQSVSLNTASGVVTLEGSVKNMKDQQKIMTEIQKITGVKNVKSNLKIQEEDENE